MALAERGMVVKWTRTPTFRVLDSLGPRENQAIASALSAIYRDTGLAIERNDTLAKSDITLELSDEDFAKALNATGEFGGLTRPVFGTYNGELVSASVRIRRDWQRGGELYFYSVSAHELLHAIGFPGHAQGFESISSYRNQPRSYTSWDDLFMRVLYDKRLRPGVPRVFALPLACHVLHEMLLAERNVYVSDLARTGEQPYCAQLAAAPVQAKSAIEQLRIAMAYAHGTGVAKDSEQAKLWAKRAADQGSAEAKKLEDELAGLAAPGQKIALRTPAVGTVFRTTADMLTVTHVDGANVDTASANEQSESWRGLFLNRPLGTRADPAEASLPMIWPLELGKALTINERAGPDANAPVTVRTVIKVLRSELVTVAGRPVPTLVVERQVHSASSEGTYTYWYAPEYGFHMKYSSAFKGRSSAKAEAWTVTDVRPPPPR